MYSLDNSLQVILPHLSSTLVSPDVLPSIRSTARVLAPLFWGGFECRLGKNRNRVDFHQGIIVHNDNLTLLDNHISSTLLIEDDKWKSIQEFCTLLRSLSSPLHEKVTQIVFEFDHSSFPSRIPIPSLFIRFIYLPPDGQLFDAIEAALEMFLSTSVRLKLLPNLHRCLNACPDGAYINNIGIMLSRPSKTVRVNVGGVSQMQFQDFLADTGWEGAATDVEAVFSQLSGLVDHIVLCLDIGAKVYPKIGLECSLDRTPDKEPRWPAFLDHLIENGLCTPAKRDALLAWPGYSDPTVCPERWPGNLIVESMLKASDKFSLFYRNLSHIKVIYQPNSPLEAKGYIGFKHDWTDIRRGHQPEPAVVPAIRP